MSGQANLVYRFGEFELEPRERRLSGGGQGIALTPKVFDTLVLLVERAGRAVTKDELMKTLWPRGYIDEATLSNHIWLIRRALGDTAKSTRFIETIPKLGYRFAAPVVVARAEPSGPAEPAPVSETPTLGVAATSKPSALETTTAAATPIGAASAPGVASKPRRLRDPGTVAMVAALLLLAILTWQAAAHWRSGDAPDSADQTVAVVGFNNLSKNAKDAWLGPALVAMLGTELGAAEHIRVLPDELLRDSGQEVSAPLAGGFTRDTLALLRRRLNADYVVSGSYLVGTAVDDPSLRVDISLQDGHSGAVVAALSNQAELSALNLLVNQAGLILRDKLGVSAGAGLLVLVAKTQPPTTDVARRIGLALDALQRYDAALARDELLEAVAEAPGYGPAYLYLARAWSALGYRQKALAAAEQAASRAADLPPEVRLQITAAVQTERYEWSGAAQTWQSLVALKPLTLEYRLELIDADIAAGNLQPAPGTLGELRRLPQASGDPRVALAAARLARARDDARSDAAQAAEALLLARLRDAPGLIADAEVELATAHQHLGQYEPATTELTAAISGYGTIGNPRGEVAARRLLAAMRDRQHRGQEARDEYQRAMALAQRIGDAGGVAIVYRDLCSMLWISGDRDGSRAAARQALSISRDTGDLRLQAWTLRALATIAADEAATDDVMGEYMEVTALTERSHDPGGHVWSLATNADLMRMRGDLAAAQDNCTRAQVEAATLTDPQFSIYSDFTCATVAVDRGDNATARALLAKVAHSSEISGNDAYASNAQLLLGQIEMEESHCVTARDHLRRAVQSFKAIEARTGEADAEALLAQCAQVMGDTAERDRALGHANQLRSAITSLQEIYSVDISLALLSGVTAPHADAVSRLRDLALDADRRRWLNWSLEAKLAEWRLLALQGKSAAAAAVRADAEAEARQHGFNRIISLMHSTPPKTI